MEAPTYATMPSRNVYHVVPHDDRWAVRREGSEVPSASGLDEDAALEAAVDIVKTLGIGRVVVHGDGGKISAVHTYDQLPTFDDRSWLDAVLSQPALALGVAAGLVAVGVVLARRR